MEDIKKILKTIKKININKYDKQWKIYEFVVKNPDSIISIEDNNYYRIEPLNIETFLTEEKWCTYNDCVKMIFWLDNDELYVTVQHYTHKYGQHIYAGIYELELEWKAKIKLPIEFLKNIRTELNYEFTKYCNDKYEEYLLEQKHIWIENFKKTILD